MTQNLTHLFEASIKYEDAKNHLENMIGAVCALLDREENRDVDTVEQFVAAVKWMNENGGMTFRAREMQAWLLEQENKPHQ